MSEPLRGLVARILDESTVVLNLGSTHGVTPGMRFIIYVEGDEITDPVSGQSLGRLELVKGIVEATHVQASIAVAIAPSSEQAAETPTVLSAVLASTNTGAPLVNRARLNVRVSDISGVRSAGPIVIGDQARSV